MAINDDLNRDRVTGTRAEDRRTEARDGMGMLPIIIAVIAALALLWWAFGDRLGTNNSSPRTSAPVTGSPNTGTGTSAPATTPKQP